MNVNCENYLATPDMGADISLITVDLVKSNDILLQEVTTIKGVCGQTTQCSMVKVKVCWRGKEENFMVRVQPFPKEYFIVGKDIMQKYY